MSCSRYRTRPSDGEAERVSCGESSAAAIHSQIHKETRLTLYTRNMETIISIDRYVPSLQSTRLKCHASKLEELSKLRTLSGTAFTLEAY
jgi:hypothetical protein